MSTATLETNRIADVAHGSNGANGNHPVAMGQDLTESRFAIGRDKLNDALKELESDADKQTIERFWTYCAQRNYGRQPLSKLIRKGSAEPGSYIKKKGGKPVRVKEEFYSADSIYQLLIGKRMRDGANIRPMLQSIELFLEKVQPNTRTNDFIETRLHREIKTYCERVKRLKRIGFIFGRMSVGKSTSGRRIAAEDPSCLYTAMPERGQLGDYLRHVGGLTVMGTRQTNANLRERIIAAIPDMLIVDDADECFRSLRNSWGVDTLQFIKSVYEKRERGIVVMMDNVGRDKMLRGEHRERLLRLWRRRVPPLQLPDAPYEEDLVLFSEEVGLSAAPTKRMTVQMANEAGEVVGTFTDSPRRLQDDVCSREDGGIGVWRMLLKDAQEIADEQGREISWAAVLKAYALFEGMEQQARPDDEIAAVSAADAEAKA